VFDKLTPGWDWIVTVGVEFGWLYGAITICCRTGFMVVVVARSVTVLTAMLVNGAGVFTSVISVVQ